MKIKVLVLIIAIVFLLLILNSHVLSEKIELSTLDRCSQSCPEIQKQEKKEKPLELILYMFPKLKEKEKLLAIKLIKQQDKVKDAGISQNNGIIILTLIIDYGTSLERAKELGDNFIRLVKTHSIDVNPEEKIGKGLYKYTIVVVYPNKEEAVRGIKELSSESITWKK